MRITTILLAFGLAGIVSCGTATNGESPVHGGPPLSSVATTAYGVVHRTDGTPAPGIMINASSLDDPTRAIPELAVLTDEHGIYEWPLVPGRYQLQANADGAAGSVDVTVVDGQRTRANIDLKN